MNKEILYGIGGLVLGLVIMLVLQSTNNGQGWGKDKYMEGSKSMHNMMMDKNNSMDHMMSNMTAALQGKTGDDFDKTFISEMIVHHEGAVEMAKLAEKNAKHQEIKDMSAAIISAQTKEIEQMKAWQSQWYK